MLVSLSSSVTSAAEVDHLLGLERLCFDLLPDVIHNSTIAAEFSRLESIRSFSEISGKPLSTAVKAPPSSVAAVGFASIGAINRFVTQQLGP